MENRGENNAQVNKEVSRVESAVISEIILALAESCTTANGATRTNFC